jgi:amidase/aspartyl-tRNA(Asn)/glutamyl-tRNA(Gln) amidotransferase subunit A
VGQSPLAGLAVSIKDLFDVHGQVTQAGSIVLRNQAPAKKDCLAVARLRAAGAGLIGRTNMVEFAFSGVGINPHHGTPINPADSRTPRIPGGPSSGAAVSVALGEAWLALGSDTNGSIRVPASLCGVFGLKPTFGRLPRTGSYPFVASLDHLGPFARDVGLLARAYDAMQGPDAADPACAQRPPEPTAPLIERGSEGLRVAVLDGWFRTQATAPARAAVDRVAAALGASRLVDWPEAHRARAAAFLITNAEGSALHLADLKRRAQDFEPLSRDRFLAGALLPAAWIAQAQRLRRWFAQEVAKSFRDVDLFLAPATPCVAPPIGTEWLEIAGQRLPARASMGLLTQPVSCIGLPVATVPVWGCDPAQPHLPMGVQLIAAPWREDLCLRAARALEAAGVAQAPLARLDVGPAGTSTAATPLTA